MPSFLSYGIFSINPRNLPGYRTQDDGVPREPANVQLVDDRAVQAGTLGDFAGESALAVVTTPRIELRPLSAPLIAFRRIQTDSVTARAHGSRSSLPPSTRQV